MLDLGFGIWDLGFGMLDLGFGIWDSGFGIWDSGCGIWDAGFGMWDAGFGIWDAGCGGLVLRQEGCELSQAGRIELDFTKLSSLDNSATRGLLLSGYLRGRPETKFR